MNNKLIPILLIVFISSFGINKAIAQQQGDVAFGGNLNFGTYVPTVSIGLNAQYNFTDEIRVVGNFDYFIKNNGLTTFDITFDAHYIFPISDKFAAYPLVGFGLSIASYGDRDNTYSSSRVPFVTNIGGGVQYYITDNFRINFEIKGRLGNHVSQLVIGPSFVYMF